MALLSQMVCFKPSNGTESVLFSESLACLNRLQSLRRQRLVGIDTGLLPELWMVVLVGGALNIGLTFLVTTRDIRLNMLLTSSYAFMIGLMIFLILAVDHPLWGKVCVKPTAFQGVRESMTRNTLIWPGSSVVSPSFAFPGYRSGEALECLAVAAGLRGAGRRATGDEEGDPPGHGLAAGGVGAEDLGQEGPERHQGGEDPLALGNLVLVQGVLDQVRV